jgi:hypothetical protein
MTAQERRGCGQTKEGGVHTDQSLNLIQTWEGQRKKCRGFPHWRMHGNSPCPASHVPPGQENSFRVPWVDASSAKTHRL